jgi:hypothetical protein
MARYFSHDMNSNAHILTGNEVSSQQLKTYVGLGPRCSDAYGLKRDKRRPTKQKVDEQILYYSGQRTIATHILFRFQTSTGKNSCRDKRKGF